MKYAVILMKVSNGRLPSKEQLSIAFQKLYYRPAEQSDFDAMKIDMLNEYVILMK